MKNQTEMTPMVDPEKMFPEVEKMIYHQCWKFAKQYPITFDELKSEAYYAFTLACYDYKEGCGTKFSTWCNFWVWTKLKDLITARTKDPHVLVDMVADDELSRRQTEELLGEADTKSAQFNADLTDLMDLLTDDACELLEMILHAPKEVLAGDRPTPRQLVARIRKHLVANGKTKVEVDEAHLELKEYFTHKWAA